MIVSTIPASNCTPQTIVIGRRGTYDTMQIAFDLSYLVESYGNGVAVLAVKRSQDESAYPAVTTQEDDLLLWTISETDTYYVGSGECQLMWYVDGGLAKTIIYPMVVMRDILSTSEEPPDGYENWVESLIAEGAETLQNAQDAAQSASDAEDAKDDAVAAKEAAEAALEEFTTPTASATTLAAGSQATAEYSDGNFAFGIPRGADGSPGTPGAPGADGVTPDFSIGTVTTLEPTQPATATITGTPEAPVLNLGIPKGAKGDPGQGGGSVDSVNGQTGAVVLDAGDLEFDDSETYPSGTVGAALTNQKNAISANEEAVNELNETVLPETTEITEALAFYPFTAPNGSTVVVRSKNGAAYASSWNLLFYASDKTTVLQFSEIATSETEKNIDITVDGIAYARTNVDFSGDALISVLSGNSLVEKVANNTSNIANNAEAIAKNTKDINDIKTGNTNFYSGISLILGRVYNGVYSDAITSVHCTDYMPIIPGRTYAIYGGYINQEYSNYYDSNKVYKGALPLAKLNNTGQFSNSDNFLVFTAPSDAAYTRINFFNNALIDGDKLKPEWYFKDVTSNEWLQKKILVIGDSISTDVYGNYKKWVTDLIDAGFLSAGLVTNNSQHATGFVATYVENPNSAFLARLTAVGDLTGFDAVITFGGINDWIQSIDFDTFKAAVDAYFTYLVEHATQARLVVFSPLHTSLYGTTNSAGKTQKDYDDYIKSVAKDYAFPCLNLTDESGFCPDKSATFSNMWTLQPAGSSDHDGVHPNETWEKDFLAPMINGFLSGM